MIDFNKFNTEKLIKFYKNNYIFPKINNVATIKYLKNESINTHQKMKNDLVSFFTNPSINIKDYFITSLNYSIQSFLKGTMYYLLSESSDNVYDNNLSIKFLNLYYSHVFLSYGILQLNGINFEIKNNSIGKNEIFIKYVDLNTFEITENGTGILKNDINHEDFWKIYYGIIINNKSDLFIDLIPNGVGYFQENNFLNRENESKCRNFYTYNYSSVISWNILDRNPIFYEKIKVLNNYTSNTSIQRVDCNKIKTTVEKEMIYLMGLLKKLSYKKDFNQELMSIFKNPKLKSRKHKLIHGIDDFLYNLDSFNI